MKNTNSEQTFSEGFKGLLEYLKYPREDVDPQEYL